MLADFWEIKFTDQSGLTVCFVGAQIHLMKILPTFNIRVAPYHSNRLLRCLRLAVGSLLFAGMIPGVVANTLYYDRVANPGWFSGTGWSETGDPGTFTLPWQDNNIAAIIGGTGTVTLNLGGNTATVAGLSRSDGAITRFSTGTIHFNSAEILGTSLLRFGSGLTVSGDFTMVGSNTLDFVTVGSFYDALGHVTINAGEFRLGWTDNSEISVTMASLSGSGGLISTRAIAGNDDSPVQSVIINQSINTTYSGTLKGIGEVSGNINYLQITKSGSGHLVLDGTVDDLRQTTIVQGGGLHVNTVATGFGDAGGTTAILVQSGAVLGGTGTIVLGFENDRVVVEDGGGLVAGDRIGTGITTYNLSAGGSLDLSGVTDADGWLHFNLGSDAIAGDTYSAIVVSGGVLDIGTGLLNFSDFDFTLLSGFGVGEYVLFEADSLVGSLGGSLVGSLGAFTGELSQVGNEIHLTVIPEPLTAGLVAGVLALAVVRLRRSSFRGRG